MNHCKCHKINCPFALLNDDMPCFATTGQCADYREAYRLDMIKEPIKNNEKTKNLQ